MAERSRIGAVDVFALGGQSTGRGFRYRVDRTPLPDGSYADP